MNTLFTLKYFLKLSLLLLAIVLSSNILSQDSNSTPTWQQCIEFYKELDIKYQAAALIEVGKTDAGKPLHLFILNKQQVFHPELFDQKKVVVLINNAIHAGEPDGVNASMQFCDSLLNPSSAFHHLLDKMIFCVIPVYNIDGALNRNSTSRMNQNGPREYGFRANSRNLDLNRDFIKCDSKNSIVFNMLYHRIKPHVVVDTHVSNGADYPYTMTLISTQSDKLGETMGKYIRNEMEPKLYGMMKEEGFSMCPYVNMMGRTPESGLIGFLETPRFSTGYTALFGTLGFVTETHMLKPFDLRVRSTFSFFRCLGDYIYLNDQQIINVVRDGRDELLNLRKVALAYKLDTAKKETFYFNGYRASMKESKVGTGERLFYDTTQKWQEDIPYFRNYRPENVVDVPDYYIVPQAWHQVLDRLKYNGVLMQPLKSDTIIEVECYYISDYKTSKDPYEGHYVHSAIKANSVRKRVGFFRGDVLIPTSQFCKRYLVETLEPTGEDSFFAWNFFDSVLQQKEWFSDYVFEEKAEEILVNNPDLRARFNKAMEEDEGLRTSHQAQLSWIYKNSDLVESSAFRYPVFRYNPE